MLATIPGRVPAPRTDAPETPDVLDLLLRHEHEIGRLLSAIDDHERKLAVELRPMLAARRDEIDGAQRRLASIRNQQDTAARLEAVTSSWIWRATAPLRWVSNRLTGPQKGERR